MKIYIRFGLMAFWVLALNSLNLLFAQERIPFTNYEGVELEARIDEITGTATQIYGIRESVELYSLSRAQLDSSSIGINYDCWGVLLESSIEFSEAKQEEF